MYLRRVVSIPELKLQLKHCAVYSVKRTYISYPSFELNFTNERNNNLFQQKSETKC